MNEHDERRLMAEMTTTPQTNGEAPLPRRQPRGLLPSTWTGRSIRLEYGTGDGAVVNSTGTLLGTYAAGPIFNIAGAKTLIAWERIAVLELVED